MTLPSPGPYSPYALEEQASGTKNRQTTPTSQLAGVSPAPPTPAAPKEFGAISPQPGTDTLITDSSSANREPARALQPRDRPKTLKLQDVDA